MSDGKLNKNCNYQKSKAGLPASDANNYLLSADFAIKRDLSPGTTVKNNTQPLPRKHTLGKDIDLYVKRINTISSLINGGLSKPEVGYLQRSSKVCLQSKVSEKKIILELRLKDRIWPDGQGLIV